MKNKIEFYDIKETIGILNSKEKLVYVDDGVDEVVVKYKDLPYYIVDINRDYGSKNLKVYPYPPETMKPLLTTFGEFLDKCDSKVREDIIDILIDAQTHDIKRNYKIIDEDTLEDAREEIKKGIDVKILSTWVTDFDDFRVNALVYQNGKVKANIIESFERNIENNSVGEVKENIKDNYETYFHLPKISKCSKLLQEVYDEVCNSDANMCHITEEDWQNGFVDKYSKKDLDTLYSEIKKYRLEDILEINDKEYLIKDGYSTEEELKNYKSEYKIVGYGDLSLAFNDDRNINVRSKDYER